MSELLRYLVWDNNQLAIVGRFARVAEALTHADPARGVVVYEPLAMTAAERVAAGPDVREFCAFAIVAFSATRKPLSIGKGGFAWVLRRELDADRPPRLPPSLYIRLTQGIPARDGAEQFRAYETERDAFVALDAAVAGYRESEGV